MTAVQPPPGGGPDREEGLLALGEMAAGVVHDVNNLLGAVLGSCELLLDGGDPADPDRDEVLRIRDAALRARDLARHLLLLARGERRPPVDVDLAAAIEALAPILRRLVGPRVALGLELRACRARIDPGALDRILINLARNARDAMPGGGTLTLRLAERRVERAAPAADGRTPLPGRYAVLEVVDSGSGFPEALRGEAFRRFFTTKADSGGTGLGLPTVAGIVRDHDGFVWIESIEGEGATVRVLLPALAAGDAAPACVERPAPTVSAASGTVLVVDDDDTLRTFVCRALRGRGYRVLEAADGAAALVKLATADAVDLLIADRVLPDIDGAVVVERARALRPEPAIVVTSGYVTDPTSGADAGDGGFVLPKPFTLAELARAVELALAERVRRRSPTA